jgi:hypothetical protein
MALTDDERQRVRYHLGYMSVTAAVQITYGIAKPAQTLFLVELAMNNLMGVAEDKVRQILGIMDGIECRLVDAQDRFLAESIDQLKLRDNEPDKLEAEYRRWGGRLADTLGVPFYAYSDRYKQGANTIQNVSVRG